MVSSGSDKKDSQQVRASLLIRLTGHFKDRLSERNLIMGDILHVLKHGFVLNDPESASRPGTFRYAMECVTPNSGSRTVRLILIPTEERDEVKLVTVMWADEVSHFH